MTERPTTHDDPSPQPSDVPTAPAEPIQRGEATGGALTGETGVLTPESDPEPLVTGERRDVEDALHRAEAAQLRHPPASGVNDMTRGSAGSLSGPIQTAADSGLSGLQGDATMGFAATPSAGTAAGAGATELSELEGGYGSEEGQSATDPAYRRDSHLPPSKPEKAR